MKIGPREREDLRILAWIVGLITVVCSLFFLFVLMDDAWEDDLAWIFKCACVIVAIFLLVCAVGNQQPKPRRAHFVPDEPPRTPVPLRYPPPAWERKPIITPPPEAKTTED